MLIKRKAAMTAVVLCMVFMLTGCGLFATKPVTLAPGYRTQLQSAVMVIEELERRNEAGTLDPNDFGLAMATARETLEEILKADDIGVTYD